MVFTTQQPRSTTAKVIWTIAISLLIAAVIVGGGALLDMADAA